MNVNQVIQYFYYTNYFKKFPDNLIHLSQYLSTSTQLYPNNKFKRITANIRTLSVGISTKCMYYVLNYQVSSRSEIRRTQAHANNRKKIEKKEKEKKYCLTSYNEEVSLIDVIALFRSKDSYTNVHVIKFKSKFTFSIKFS